MAQIESKTFGEKLLSIPRQALFLILFIGVSIPLFFNVQLPNEPSDASKKLFATLEGLKEGDQVIVQSDWTESTRGENRGQMDALLRILMRKKVKFAICSVADPQAPQVARNVIRDINAERKLAGEPIYNRWEDWIDCGYFPNGEGFGESLAQSIGDTFKTRLDAAPGQPKRPVMQSPVLQGIDEIGDLKLFMVVTGTKSITIAIERLSNKVTMAGMVTGVMGPETLNYYVSNQLKGLSVGLKGVYDMETQMSTAYQDKKFLDKGTRYIFTLHVGIALLVLAVIIGNVGVVLTRKRRTA